jgi:hypothetical protein
MRKVIIGRLAAVASAALFTAACGLFGSSHSASYQSGYDAGSQGGIARNQANINVGGTMGHPYSVDNACKTAEHLVLMSPKESPKYVANFSKAEFEQGCAAAFNDHPVGTQG